MTMTISRFFSDFLEHLKKPGPFLFNSCLTILQTQFSGRSRPSDKGEGPGHPEPKIRGWGAVSKKCFYGPSDIVWSKNKGRPGPQAPPLDPSLHFANFSKRWLLRIEDLTSYVLWRREIPKQKV